MKTGTPCLGIQARTERSTTLAPALLSVAEVSQLTGVAVATLNTWRSRGTNHRKRDSAHKSHTSIGLY